jgi:hypothetical protein
MLFGDDGQCYLVMMANAMLVMMANAMLVMTRRWATQ